MVVDVAHAHSLTLKEIAAISSKPIMDSHTNPAPVGNPSENNDKGICRMRSWDEMEKAGLSAGDIQAYMSGKFSKGFLCLCRLKFTEARESR